PQNCYRNCSIHSAHQHHAKSPQNEVNRTLLQFSWLYQSNFTSLRFSLHITADIVQRS
ncbi:hypothetical protein X975_19874, partial [Stegodyphus mimosarum]